MANGSQSVPVILSSLLEQMICCGIQSPLRSPASKHGNWARPSTGINLTFVSRERVLSPSPLFVDHGKHYHRFPHLNHATLSGRPSGSVLCPSLYRTVIRYGETCCNLVLSFKRSISNTLSTEPVGLATQGAALPPVCTGLNNL